MEEMISTMATEPIAIIGLSFKLPGDATSAETFWEMLLDAQCAVSDVPDSRFNADAFHHMDTNRLDTLPTRRAHFLKDDPTAFDAPFFSISGAEAAAMDPQSRLLLEMSYKALENAGIPATQYNGSKTSVHIGCSSDDYRLIYHKDPERPLRHAATGMSASMIANKISWFFDLRGPSVHIDTACSATLTALHIACQSLRNGEASMGLVGGVNLFLTPDSMSPLAHLNFFGSEGRCYSFDHRAQGYSRGEACSVVVIKLLSDAIRDGDPIRAVIRNTGINENGRTPGGITKVRIEAQEALIRETYRKVGLELDNTRYVEAHGPGTEGDVAECRTLGTLFGEHHTQAEPVYVGSVKANVGHSEGGSGMASLIKVILMLERGIIPRLANFEQVHPDIDPIKWHLKFPTENVPWPPGLRRASINSFAFGGSNAHAILEDAHHHLTNRRYHTMAQVQPRSSYLAANAERLTHGPFARLLVCSAADEGGLQRIGQAFADYGKSKQPLGLELMNDLAYTMSQKRNHLPWRSFAIARQPYDIQNVQELMSKPVRARNRTELGYIFTGQGAQYAQMGWELLEFTVFRQSMERSQLALDQEGAVWTLLEELRLDPTKSRIIEPAISQPLCTALQIALVDLLRSFGVRPTAVIGHSSGEIAAAYCAGAISQEFACKIAFHRGRLAGQLASASRSFGMMAVGLSPEDVRRHLDHQSKTSKWADVSIGCYNSPRNITLTGDFEQLTDFRQSLVNGTSTFARMLKVDVAYHSQFMELIASEYAACLEGEGSKSVDEEITLISTVTGESVSASDLSQPTYWVKNLTSPVLFTQAIENLVASRKIDGLVEIGPHHALRGPLREILDESKNGTGIKYHHALARSSPPDQTLLTLLGKLHCEGCLVDLAAVSRLQNNSVTLTDLPEYPFNHTRSYWHESRISRNFRKRRFGRLDLLGNRALDWNPLEARWRNIIRTLENPWIEDHMINGALIYPGAGMLVMVIEAALQYSMDTFNGGISGFKFRDVEFVKSLNISSAPEGVETQLYLRPLKDASERVASWMEFRICLLENEEWAETCHGQIMVTEENTMNEVDNGQGAHMMSAGYGRFYQDIAERCTQHVDHTKFYTQLKEFGYDLGSTFQVFDNIQHNNKDEAIATIDLRQWTIRSKPEHSQPHVIHPTALDGVLQLSLPALGQGLNNSVPVMVPRRIKKLWISAAGLSGAGTSPVRACCRAIYKGLRDTEAQVVVMNATGDKPLITADGVESFVFGQNIRFRTEERRLCQKLEWIPAVEESISGIQSGEITLPKNSDEEPPQTRISKPTAPPSLLDFALLVGGEDARQQDIASEVRQALRLAGVDPVRVINGDEEGLRYVSSNTFCLLLCNVNHPIEDLSASIPLNMLKKIAASAFGLLVIAACRHDGNPENEILGGLARTLRTENPTFRLVTLMLSAPQQAYNNLSRMVSYIMSDVGRSGPRGYEPEYRERNGKLYVSRLREDSIMNGHLAAKAQSQRLEQIAWRSHQSLVLSAETPGLLDTLHFIEDQNTWTTLADNEIEVSPCFVGLNYRDCLVALGRIPHLALGFECSGVVTKAGALSDLRPGDRVALCTSGTLRSLVRCHYLTAIKIPDTLDMADAASFPVVSTTVYHALHNVANLQAHESILIHSAAGATGQLAIQLAKSIGAFPIYVTVGSAAKKIFLMETYDIPESHIFYSRNTNFADGVMRETAGQGVDVVLNSLTGHSLTATWECIAPFGRFIELGKQDAYANKPLPMQSFARSALYAAMDLVMIWEKKPPMMRMLLQNVFQMLEVGKLKPALPLTCFKINRVEEGLRLLQSGKNVGKLVIDMTTNETVPAVLSVKPTWNLALDATYVIAGGLGGLGRAIARWLVKRGARNLALLSRSGPATEEARALLQEFKSVGVNVLAPQCDITDAENLKSTVEEILAHMPPIKGCIQATMVLRDNLFASMTPEDWAFSLAPKVTGSWNLHTLLPQDMTFFILLSSLSGVVGGAGQANYASGNTYLDGLARYRFSRGENSVSLDLGLMLSEGKLIENPRVMTALDSTGVYKLMKLDELFALLDRYCDPATYPLACEDDAQVVCGIETPMAIRAKGALVPAWMQQPLFNNLYDQQADDHAAQTGKSASNYKSRVAASSSPNEAAEIVTEALVSRLSRSLAIPPTDIESHRPLYYYAVDSLVAVELQNWFRNEFEADLSVFEILGNRSSQDVGQLIVERSGMMKQQASD